MGAGVEMSVSLSFLCCVSEAPLGQTFLFEKDPFQDILIKEATFDTKGAKVCLEPVPR